MAYGTLLGTCNGAGVVMAMVMIMTATGEGLHDFCWHSVRTQLIQ